MRTPRHLFASDFDGTLVLTSEPSPHNITVESATADAIYQLFGDAGLLAFGILNGLQSREPYKLIKLIIETAHKQGFDLPGSEIGVDRLTEQFVYHKLELITPEISPQWPVLFPGCENFIRSLPDIGADLAVVSSGHDEFIRRVFEVNDLTQPEILITSDTLRRNKVPGRFKPDPYSLELARQKFIDKNGEIPVSSMYIGDSRVKDGEMAVSAGVPFGHFDPSKNHNMHIDPTISEVAFGNFHQLHQYFTHNAELFASGEGFKELFRRPPMMEGNRSGKERL